MPISVDPVDEHATQEQQHPILQPDQSSSTGQTSEGTLSDPPTSSPDLPPAAIDLAAKLFDLARSGSTDTLKAYMDAGVPSNLTNHAGDTLLMHASYHDHPSTVSMLLSKHADPNVLNGSGQEPVADSVFKGHKEVVEILVRAGADVSAGQPNALDTARMFRRQDLLRILRTGQGVFLQVTGWGSRLVLKAINVKLRNSNRSWCIPMMGFSQRT